MQEVRRSKLITYVQKKYKLPVTMPVDVSESGFVGGTCYRQLRFRSGDARRPFQIDLIASPDFRFLARDLMDSQVDPLEEEREKERALVADLRRGSGAELGPKDAPVTITLFSDFQCPFCAQMARGLFKEIMPDEAGRVRAVFRNFPLSMHAWARPAAEAAECARQQGDKYFWNFHDYLFQHQKEISRDNLRQKLTEYGPDLAGFDMDSFGRCLDERKASAKVEEDLVLGRKIGITATPTIFINTQRITGFRPEQIRTLIEQMSPSEKKADGGPAANDSPARGPEPGPAGQRCTPLKCDR
jgi:predicted DsbA family dithiol-disulfide isomerase